MVDESTRAALVSGRRRLHFSRLLVDGFGDWQAECKRFHDAAFVLLATRRLQTQSRACLCSSSKLVWGSSKLSAVFPSQSCLHGVVSFRYNKPSVVRTPYSTVISPRKEYS